MIASPAAPSPAPPVATATGGASAVWLALAALVTVAAWQIPYGDLALYPFTILATWFHEMGHGVAALVLGGELDRLELFADGSGVAHWRGVGFGRFTSALVAAGGPLGPPLAGALLILAGRSPRANRIALALLGLAVLAATALWVRTLFGFASMTLWGVAILAAASLRSASARTFAVQLLGVQACVSSWRQIDYLFTRAVVIDGQALPSDTGQIASALFLPHWVWGALLTAVAAALLVGSLLAAYRGAPAAGSG